MDRAAIGLGAVFLHLGAQLNFHRLFEAAIEGFDLAKVEARQADAFARTGVDFGVEYDDRALSAVAASPVSMLIASDATRWLDLGGAAWRTRRPMFRNGLPGRLRHLIIDSSQA